MPEGSPTAPSTTTRSIGGLTNWQLVGKTGKNVIPKYFKDGKLVENIQFDCNNT